MKCIGGEVTEKIDRVPAGLVRRKRASRCGAAGVSVRPLPAPCRSKYRWCSAYTAISDLLSPHDPESTRTMPFSAAALAFLPAATGICRLAELLGN